MRCTSIIKVEQLGKLYDKIVFKKLSFSVLDGDIVIVVGPSGVGKTTFLNIIMGLDKDYEGTIEGTEHCRFSAVFQEDRLLEKFSVVNNVRLVLSRKYTDEELENMCSSILPRSVCYKPCNELSGGMKRRVEIIKAIMAESDIICMDEPFKGLDRNTKEQVVQYVLNNRGKRTMFIVTHDTGDIELINPNRIIKIEN